jgi:hypothetical protein
MHIMFCDETGSKPHVLEGLELREVAKLGMFFR